MEAESQACTHIIVVGLHTHIVLCTESVAIVRVSYWNGKQ